MKRKYKTLLPSNDINIKLYKYFPNIEHAKNCIINKNIHIENLHEYNDIFEASCAMTVPNIKLLSNEDNCSCKMLLDLLKGCQYSYLLSHLENIHFNELCSNNCTTMEDVIDIFYNNIDDPKLQDKDIMYRGIVQYMGGKKRKYVENLKCGCFSEVNDSLLMWSYYANSHAGVCLEFDFSSDDAQTDDIVKSLCKIKYSSTYRDMWTDQNAVMTKSLQWHHEQEWRIVFHEPDTEFIEFPYVSAVYLGARVDKQTESDFMNFAKINSIRIFKMHPALDKYELVPKEIHVDNI